MDMFACSGSPIGEDLADFGEDMGDGASGKVALGDGAATDLPPWAQAGMQIADARNIAISVELGWERFFILTIVINSLPFRIVSLSGSGF